MQLSLMISVLVMTAVAIGAINASPSPIRCEYDQTLQKDSDPDVDFEKRFKSPQRSEGRIVRYNEEDLEELTSEEVKHFISKRSPERIVINYKPPPANGPRNARDIDDYE